MRKLYRYLKPNKNKLILAVVFLLLQNIGALYLPNLTADIINVGVAQKDLDYIYKTGALMLVVAVMGGFGAILSTWFSATAMAAFCRDLREAVFQKTMEYSISDFREFGAASLITRCTSDITIIQRAGMMFLRMLLPVPMMMAVGFTFAFRTNARISWYLLAFTAFFIVVAFFIGRRAIPLFELLQIKMDRMTHVLREKITGVRVIRAFNRQNFEKDRFHDTCQDFCDVSININRIFAVLIPVLFFLLDMSGVFILWFGGIEVVKGEMQIGSIFALIQYMTIILFSGVMASMVFMEVPRAMACARRLNAVLDMQMEMEETDEEPQSKLKGTLEFRNVTFRYPGAEESVLSDITFTAKPGQVTAVIGGTGSGKSTVANLIPRFFSIQDGEILIDGINITQYPQKTLRDKIGFIPQKSFLFRGTIISNIRYGKEDASIEEIKHAAKIAQADNFISGLDKGYDSYVAQGGNNLSGGQKQRVAIARALVKKPEIYVFDDSFSALDFHTDAMLRKALKGETKKSAVVIVAQRISTVMDADQIIVLDEGKMAGIGRHSELMKTCPVYQQIAASQLSEEELSKKEVG